MQLIVSCEYGLEPIVIDELAELGYHGETVVPSRILVSIAEIADIYDLSIAARTIQRVFILIGDFTCNTLDEIYQAGSSVDFSNWIEADQTFGVRGTREGDHDYGSMDVAASIGQCVIDHFNSQTGKRITVNLDEPDVEIMAHLSGDRLLLMIATSNCSLHKRIERPYQHFAALKPSIAAAMLRKSSWKKYGSVLDPMAGSGIIPIDAALQARNIPPGSVANHSIFQFSKLAFLDYQEFLKRCELYKENVMNNNELEIMAGDRYPKSIAGMKQNMAFLGVENDITIHHGDAEDLTYLNIGDAPCIVTNPPYGMRIGNPGIVKALYKNFARSCAEKQVEEITAITPRRHHWIVSFTSHGYKVDYMQRFYFGRLNVFMIRVKAKTN